MYGLECTWNNGMQKGINEKQRNLRITGLYMLFSSRFHNSLYCKDLLNPVFVGQKMGLIPTPCHTYNITLNFLFVKFNVY